MRIGARGSALAQWQANWVAGRLNSAGIETGQVIIHTHGDQVLDRPLRDLGVQGVFTKEIENALMDNRIDIAVHSYKDMPLVQPDGLAIIAVSPREDPSDMLVINRSAYDVTAPYFPLREGSIVGTSAVRRATQLQAYRPDLQSRDLRGNVQTRLRRLQDGEYSAIFLATAGVNRLDLKLDDFETAKLNSSFFVPSPAQGILAIEMRIDDPRAAIVRTLVNDETASQAVAFEREILRFFGGGCSQPLGVYARLEESQWHASLFWGNGRPGPIWLERQAETLEQLRETILKELREYLTEPI